MAKLTISMEGKKFLVDDLSRPGSPPVGKGRTINEAIGEYVVHNLEALGIELEIDLSTPSHSLQKWAEYFPVKGNK